MTTAAFSRNKNGYCALCVSGHSGFADKGFDIVCSAISSAVYLTANNMTEIYGVEAEFDVKDGNMTVVVKNGFEEANKALEGLCIHLCQLSLQYPQYLAVRILVQK